MKIGIAVVFALLLSGCSGYYGTYRVTHGDTTVDLQTLRAAKLKIGRRLEPTGECEVLTVEPGGLDALQTVIPLIQSAI